MTPTILEDWLVFCYCAIQRFMFFSNSTPCFGVISMPRYIKPLWLIEEEKRLQTQLRELQGEEPDISTGKVDWKGWNVEQLRVTLPETNMFGHEN